jgi:hypothetical protein
MPRRPPADHGAADPPITPLRSAGSPDRPLGPAAPTGPASERQALRHGPADDSKASSDGRREDGLERRLERKNICQFMKFHDDSPVMIFRWSSRSGRTPSQTKNDSLTTPSSRRVAWERARIPSSGAFNQVARYQPKVLFRRRNVQSNRHYGSRYGSRGPASGRCRSDRLRHEAAFSSTFVL